MNKFIVPTSVIYKKKFIYVKNFRARLIKQLSLGADH
jgi:hypothetical protein